MGNVYALNAVTGQLVWKAHPEAHPSATITATPTLYDGRLYVAVSSLEEAVNDPHYACCTFRGSLVAYDAQSGRPIWRRYTVPLPKPQGHDSAGALRMGPSGADIWSSPTIDPQRGQIYIGTGEFKWVYQARAGDAWNLGCASPDKALCRRESGPDADFGSPPLLAAGSGNHALIVAGQKSGWVYAFDPDSGL